MRSATPQRRSIPWTGFAIAAAVCVVIVRIVTAHGGATTEGRATSTAHRTTRTAVVRVGPASVPVPADWRRLESGTDHATWVAPDRSASVTLGIVAASGQPLTSTVRGGMTALGTQLPGVRDRRMAGSSAHPEVRFSVHRSTGTIGARQVWTRSAARGTDAIATWTWAPGAQPAAVPAPAFTAAR